MSMGSKYNLKSPGVKRLMREACELADSTEEYYACPLEDNLFEWHFTVKGPPSTEFEGGFYHGRILLPSQYPMQPPNIILLTPNGRFEVNKKICLSISGHHPESWQPSWSIRTALLALIAFMPVPSAGTIGSLDYTPEERQLLAKKSKNWECSICGKISEKLSTAKGTTPELTQEESNLIQKIALKAEEDLSEKNPIPTDKNSSLETDSGEACLRQRILPDADHNVVEDSNTILGTTLETSSKEKFWNTIAGILVALIVSLIIRRLFFL